MPSEGASPSRAATCSDVRASGRGLMSPNGGAASDCESGLLIWNIAAVLPDAFPCRLGTLSRARFGTVTLGPPLPKSLLSRSAASSGITTVLMSGNELASSENGLHSTQHRDHCSAGL